MGDRAKHTAGPWKWHWRSEGGLSTGSVYAEPRTGHAYAVAICPQYQKRSQWEADARLIASAPDLLAALRGLVKVNENHNESIAKIIGKPLNWKDDYLEAARAAISRATGEA